MSVSMEKIEQLADEIGDVLLSKKESVAVAEATTGGYVTGKACLYIFLLLSIQPHKTNISFYLASLMGRARASRFYNGSITVYSGLAGQELLPKEVRRQVFVKDYSDPNFNSDSYRQSKITWALYMAKHVQSRFKATYGIAESGATEASGLGKKLRPAGAFTAVAVVGPNNMEKVILYDSPELNDRRGNMKRFTIACLKNFKELLNNNGSNAKL